MFAKQKSKIHLIVIQCGVGTLAAGAASFFIERLRRGVESERPVFVLVEPTNADAFGYSFKYGAGELLESPHNGESVMGGLCCNVPSSSAFALLRDVVDAVCLIGDAWAHDAMRALAHPIDEVAVHAGQSGAAGLAALFAVANSSDARRKLALTSASRVLLVCTEGPTDVQSFTEITRVEL